jgi:hypothetical protein
MIHGLAMTDFGARAFFPLQTPVAHSMRYLCSTAASALALASARAVL